MINKIYDNIRQTIKENYKLIITFIVLLVLFTYEFPYYIESPGGIIDVDDRIIMSEKTESKGSFNLTYVSEIKATLPTLIYAKVNKDWDIFKKEEVILDNETMQDEEYRSHILLNEANNNAVIVGYTYAGKKINISNEHLYVIYIEPKAETNLKIGDEILEINHVKITDKKQLDNIISESAIGDTLTILVNRDNKNVSCYGKIRDVFGKKIIGVSLSKTSDIITNPAISFKFKKTESGPSGGFMMALSIYDSLVEEDITKGYKIVGTGTIDEHGNVGEIGGIEYKIKGAAKEKADIFLVPNGSNYEEAKKIIQKNKYNIKLISVNNFKDALNKLKNI